MARFRKKRRYSTNTIKMRFQSFMDISTNASSMQIITISAGGLEVFRRLQPQFSAYKYFRIGKISAKLVPASTLPVDPTGLSITVGDNLVDPRDQLTPGMMRITNGEDVFEDITGLSDDAQHGIYNNMLLDPRWYKWMLQSGTKRSAFPRYWQIGQLHQDKWPGAVVNLPYLQQIEGEWQAVGTLKDYKSGVAGDVPSTGDTLLAGSSALGLFQTGHRGVLGWLPTDGMNLQSPNPMMASPPEIECFKILLPKPYKTRYWYRLFITEEVWFKEPIVNFGIVAGDGLMYRPLDVFHVPSVPGPRTPDDGMVDTIGASGGSYITGGNYGDD